MLLMWDPVTHCPELHRSRATLHADAMPDLAADHHQQKTLG